MNSEEIIKKNNDAADASSLERPDDLPEDVSQGIRTKDDGKIRRVVVDRQACIGAGSCVIVTENLFQLDDENLAYVVDPDSHDQETIQLSAESCPVLAIHLYDKDGKKLFPGE
jgi:ferredoxin